MEQFIVLLVENPLYLVVAVIVSIAVLLLFLKKILKLLLVVAAVCILYVAYLYWSGGNVSETVKIMEQAVDESLRKGTDFLRNIGEKY